MTSQQTTIFLFIYIVFLPKMRLNITCESSPFGDDSNTMLNLISLTINSKTLKLLSACMGKSSSRFNSLPFSVVC